MKREHKILLVITLIGLLARLYGIGSESFWLDEAISIIWVKHGFVEGLRLVVNDVHQPLHYILLWGWSHIFGMSEIATRMLSTLFDTGSIFLVYLVAKRIRGSRTGMIASALFALSPLMVSYSQEARMYTLLVFLSLASMYCYLRLKERITPSWSLTYVVSSTLMMYTHIFGALVLLVQSIDYLIAKKSVRFHLVQAIIPFAFIPGLLITFKEFTSIRGNFWIPEPTLSSLWTTYLDFSGSILLGIVFMVIVAIAIRWYRPNPLLLYWLLIPISIMFIYSLFFTPLYQTRYILFSLPAFYIILSGMLTRLKRYHLHATMAILVICAITVGANAHQTNKDDWRMIDEEIDRVAQEEDILLVHPHQHVDPLLLYRHPSCLPDKWQCKKNDLYIIFPTKECCNENTTLRNPRGEIQLVDADSIVMVLKIHDSRYTQNPGSVLTNMTKTYDKVYDRSIRIVRYE